MGGSSKGSLLIKKRLNFIVFAHGLKKNSKLLDYGVPTKCMLPSELIKTLIKIVCYTLWAQ